ncbi:MAG: LysR family transcriptional regulator [Planctomycetaceae bacterium]|nr:LysR family transcriptional regulator [Planctomycetaceae bacterium]
MTPQLTSAVVHLTAETRSFERVERTCESVLGTKVSRSTVRRLAKQVGLELADVEETGMWTDGKEVIVPEVAVVSCDGGRIRTREPGHGRGVHLSGENGWRETKNASLERMCKNAQHPSGDDPCPDLPTSFRTTEKAANISEKPVPIVDETTDAEEDRVIYKGPKRVLRTAVSSMACSDDFGKMMKREAERRRFYDAITRAFIGDGLNWNWSVWKKYFSTFIPILDFIHAIQYIFAAAMAMASNDTEGWSTYVRLVTLCWQGHVDSVIEDLTVACQERGIQLDEKVADDDPNKPLTDAVRYLTNNRTRMDYPRYRRLGLPVTSAPMESLIKQINFRVKGTEMFWDDPEGAEAILHIRSAALSEDNRLADYLSNRPGCQFQRRTTATAVAA